MTSLQFAGLTACNDGLECAAHLSTWSLIWGVYISVTLSHRGRGGGRGGRGKGNVLAILHVWFFFKDKLLSRIGIICSFHRGGLFEEHGFLSNHLTYEE